MGTLFHFSYPINIAWISGEHCFIMYFQSPSWKSVYIFRRKFPAHSHQDYPPWAVDQGFLSGENLRNVLQIIDICLFWMNSQTEIFLNLWKLNFRSDFTLSTQNNEWKQTNENQQQKQNWDIFRPIALNSIIATVRRWFK